MHKILVGAAGVAGISAAIFGSGIASAVNEYEGMTYGNAAAQISAFGGVATVATKVGTFLPTQQCIVTGSRVANFLDARGRGSAGEVLLNLNCNNSFAAPGVPGNSMGSPEGRESRERYESQAAAQ